MKPSHRLRGGGQRGRTERGHRAAAGVAAISVFIGVGVRATELKPATIEAFSRYVDFAEERMQAELHDDDAFLWVDRLPDGERTSAYRRLQSGEVVVAEVKRSGQDRIRIPDGLVHNWVGTVLLPDISLERTVAVMQDYDHYADIYAPQVRRSTLLERQGNRFRVYVQLYEKKVLTFVANSEYVAEFIAIDDARMFVPSRTTRILEVENPGTPDEREKPEGNDRGLLWRFNNYCSLEERGAHTFVQCESISLTRDIPLLLSVIIRPFVSGLPRDKMVFTLTALRQFLAQKTDTAD